MNIGSAVRSHESEPAQTALASTCPAGVEALVRMATKPQMPRASAIHTPTPSTANSSSISSTDRASRLMPSPFLAEGNGVFRFAEGRSPLPYDGHDLVGE